MKESIVLLVLGACWAGYLAWYWRENRRTTNHRSDGIRAFSSGLGSLRGSTGSPSLGSLTPSVPVMAPRTAGDAARRRREVLVGLSVAAVVTLFAAIAIGGTAIVLHVLVDVALLAYGYAVLLRRNEAAEREMKVHMLYPERVREAAPAPRQAVNS